MSTAKNLSDMGELSSGDVGYCQYKRGPRAILIGWSGHTVVSVDCDHGICGYAGRCELYNRHPIGFTQTFPHAPASDTADT